MPKRAVGRPATGNNYPERLLVEVTPEMKEQVRQSAERQGCSMTEVARRAVALAYRRQFGRRIEDPEP